MLRTLSIAVLLAFAAPVTAEEVHQGATVAQQNQQKEQQPAQAPKRDCERNRGEGVS